MVCQDETAQIPVKSMLNREGYMFRIPIFSLILALLLSGCASYGVVQNKPIAMQNSPKSYSIQLMSERTRSDEIQVALSFSGGGSRAAALSYGVLQELRDTHVSNGQRTVRLLDEVGFISSVSGGSFTAAYYGIFGERIFSDFESVFLRQDIEGTLLHMVLNPFRWFKDTGRTTWAVDYYQKHIFKGATFADMNNKDRPLIVINATDLGQGVRFSFLQEYFDLLCSDLSSFPVARAVAASSAVPVVFHPVVVENYADCGNSLPGWLSAVRTQAKSDASQEETFTGLETFLDKEKRKYIHLVDGGITDNLGLRAILEIVAMEGGVKAHLGRVKRTPPRRLAVIAVNASTVAQDSMDSSKKQPSMMETINAMSDIQLHRYNTTTIDSMNMALSRWIKELSTPERPLSAYFIQVDFKDIQDSGLRKYFDQVPTSFSLTNEQVDKLIEIGRQLLRNNPEFRRLLRDLDT